MENLPIDILWNVVFRFLSWEEIMNICQTDARLAAMCQDESLWQFKLALDFPEFVSNKSAEISWKQYYRLLITGKMLPLYYQGDPIANIPFEPRMLEKIISLVEVNIEELTPDVNIVFIDRQLNPNIIVKYPERRIIIQDKNYDQITKIIIIVYPEFNKEFPVIPRKTRGRLRGMGYSSPEEARLGTIFRDRQIILIQLTSSNKIAIYGANFLHYGYASGSQSTSFVDYPQGEFFIWDGRPSGDARILPGWGRCQKLKYSQLYDILWYLKISPPIDPVQGEESEKIMELHNIDINANHLPSPQIDFYYTWYASTYAKPYICEAIRRKLLEVGHIF